MELLEKVWIKLSETGAVISRVLEKTILSVFGSANARYLKKIQPIVQAINALEPKYQQMTDTELKEQTFKFRRRLAAGETLDDLLIEAFAVCREAARRVLGMRHFDVQLMGGIVLHQGKIAEMATGEGKTLVATLPAYLNALEGKGVHVVTVNDYLARRDMEWMGPVYMALGMTVGAIQSQMGTAERQKAYDCDITYGTNNEFGFDYLRDNMRPAARGDDRWPKELQQVQRGLHYAIIDEVDNILIDEARTPLIISGPAHDDVSRYIKADRIARQLRRDVHFEVKEKEHTVVLTEEGIRYAEQLAGVESFYTPGNMEWPHLIDNALKAHHLYKRDVNYVVQDGEVIIVDEFTGRLMPGRHWSDGLHQAVEAKEGVPIKEENQTLATITLQNFFKLYDKICGMTGTAMTEANEFWKIYKLEVIAIPTNKPLRRINYPDVVFRTEREKFNAIVDEIERMHKWDVLVNHKGEEYWGKILHEDDQWIEFLPKGKKEKERIPRSAIKEIQRAGRPILVGTVSIEKSEMLSAMLERRGIPHQVLNAKHHQREAEIIAQAGRKGAVTIATNMAGRGTDIILGGNPEAMAWAMLQHKYPTRLDVPREEWDALVRQIEEREQMKAEGRLVASMGGLHIIGTERHEARRIDLQLRGRAGRQGDPGSSRFYVSLEDDLMRIFAGEWVKNILTRLGMQEGEAIVSPMITRRIEGAQKKVEERNFEIRKHLLEYDEVMDEQRKRVYGYRQAILEGANCKQLILEMIDRQIDQHVDRFLDKDYGTETFAEWAGKQLSIELDGRDFRGMDFPAAEQYAKEEADRLLEGQVLDALEEHLPEETDPDEWNWEALAKFCNSRWHTNFRDRDLKKIGREGLAEFILQHARQAIQETDLSRGAEFLDPQYGLRCLIQWAQRKFGVRIPLDEVAGLEPEALKAYLRQRAYQAYEEKEAEYPVRVGLLHFSHRDPSGHKRYDREGLVAWARQRFGAELSLEELRSKQRDEVVAILLEHSRRAVRQAAAASQIARQKVTEFLNTQLPESVPWAGENGRLEKLAAWIHQELGFQIPPEKLASLNRKQLANELDTAIEDRYRPEMRKMERALLLHIVDSAWKDHLLAMDHLRSSVGLRGYAQVDPKVEYKREGMQLFEQMWNTIAERVTDLIFRVEYMDESFLASLWSKGEAIHQEAPSATTEIAQQQQAAIEGTQQAQPVQPIRRREPQVGRNDPCPCGSGKKYKHCCLRKSGQPIV
jgi:preprotein translocase subunit SecA